MRYALLIYRDEETAVADVKGSMETTCATPCSFTATRKQQSRT